MAYRVPRRFIVPPEEPPPYGLFLLSFLGHAFFFLMAGTVGAYLNAQVDQSKIYIVNLVPATAPLGSPEPRVVEAPRRAEDRTPPKPDQLEAPRPRETPPPKPEKAEAPRPKETPPPKPEKVELPKPRETPPPRPDLPPPRAPEVPRPAPPRPTELALPRKAERDLTALDRTPLPETRPVQSPPAPPPRDPPPVRAPEPVRAVPAPAPPPPAAPPAVAAVRPGVEPVRLGRPDATTPTTGSISLDGSDFPFTYYLRAIQRKIGDQWAPPKGAVAGGEKAIVLFEIGRDGQIKEPAVERSSGNAIFDQSAVRAVMEASPFPPLPQGFPGPSLRVHFGFEYRPDQG
jgi:TonB family protein